MPTNAVLTSEELLPRRHRANNLGDALIWYHFVPLTGEPGQHWYIEYQDSGAEGIAYEIDRAVALLRLRRKDEACAKLDWCRQRQLSLRGSVDDAIDGVIEVGYHASLAYVHFLGGRLEKARQSVKEAQETVVEILGKAPYLLTFAQKCNQLALNEARILCTQRRWGEMFRLLDCARGMARGTAAYCELPSGPVFIEDIHAVLRGVEPKDKLDAEAIETLLDQEKLAASVDKIAVGVATPPHAASLECF